MGYAACDAAQSDALEWGQIGAGTGATVGKVVGIDHAAAGGIGFASLTLPDGIIIAAVVAVNSFGHVVDPQTQHIIAGPRNGNGTFIDSVDLMLTGSAPFVSASGENTTIGCIMTTGRLDKSDCCRVASMAHDGLGRTIRPVHTQFDGDTLFVLSAPVDNAPHADVNIIGIAAVEVVSQAVVQAVTYAKPSV